MPINQTVTTTEFARVGTDEPHKSRRKEILTKYPEIKELYGPDIRLLPSILAIAAAQLCLCVYSTQLVWYKWIVLAYSAGGTLTHWLSLGNHELAHNLCFKTTRYNEVLGMIANCAQGLPSFVTFRKYHLDHHYFQGIDEKDVDVPTEWEGKIFNTTFRKIIWVFLQPLFYAIRPLVVRPKPPTIHEAINAATTIGFDLFLWYQYGLKALLFNLCSTLLGMGLHPVAGHFIAEHYTLATGQETYSYYGPLNLVTFNVGYHNEHHDFPRVSGFRLPQVKAIAPEFYDNLHSYESWTGVIYDYIVRPDIGPFSRVKRPDPTANR
ncbi:dihydroderamide delta-4 desaturase [Phaeodactylum tricornutum CCAP 1055/1]|jgi:sphingolipid delta-4 desaturase|uniref:Dihydroderamide delta-4 desaturase n=2 Tax=Phaeodactylum tricornutum TaxID=2850 RepID=B7G870_PHATC|nr:dihydroderamide delta-4 desaturase [Phaeodactylum tricornutum CCAP 1055/1]EEC45120.1 dihydroderamide delta-4 desaturase [Phaeodactylum tricornutum CCAP 1055/1]|eukprot:XP_002183420.1 dihydroderamide delta-4 desaturase [Phaeodactylum tricornutum CCAP 1055/1]